VVAGRGGVQLGGHRLERLRDWRAGGTGALEEQVLVEVRDAARSRSSRAPREPTPVRNPSATERTFGTFSDTLRSPESSW
jgi:hypothetical protein